MDTEDRFGFVVGLGMFLISIFIHFKKYGQDIPIIISIVIFIVSFIIARKIVQYYYRELEEMPFGPPTTGSLFLCFGFSSMIILMILTGLAVYVFTPDNNKAADVSDNVQIEEEFQKDVSVQMEEELQKDVNVQIEEELQKDVNDQLDSPEEDLLSVDESEIEAEDEASYLVVVSDVDSQIFSAHTMRSTDSIVLGRAGYCHAVFSYDQHVSRQHCRITLRNDHFFIADLNSTNGTYVNGNLIEEETEIYSGDILTMGLLDIRFNAILLEKEN